jgi:hypothetical protein
MVFRMKAKLTFRDCLKIIFYSPIVFCVVSFVTVMTSLLDSTINYCQKPAVNIGFPLKYYYQFWVRGADGPNCGWRIKYFFIDCVITLLATFIVYVIAAGYKRYRLPRSTSNESTIDNQAT